MVGFTSLHTEKSIHAQQRVILLLHEWGSLFFIRLQRRSLKTSWGRHWLEPPLKAFDFILIVNDALCLHAIMMPFHYIYFQFP